MKLQEYTKKYETVSGTQHKFKCNSCEKLLGILFESQKTVAEFAQYQCICKCGGDSFIIKTHNQSYFIPDPALKIKSIDSDKSELSIKHTIVLE